MTNHGTLNQRLQARVHAQNQETQQAIQAELSGLKESLRSEYQNVLHTIGNDIQNQAQALNIQLSETLKESQKNAQSLKKVLKMQWLKTALIAMSLCLGLFSSTWGLMQYLSIQIQSQLHQIETNQAKLALMEENGIILGRCGERQKICAKVDETEATFADGYRILKTK